jgi:hypothetical protein
MPRELIVLIMVGFNYFILGFFLDNAVVKKTLCTRNI